MCYSDDARVPCRISGAASDQGGWSSLSDGTIVRRVLRAAEKRQGSGMVVIALTSAGCTTFYKSLPSALPKAGHRRSLCDRLFRSNSGSSASATRALTTKPHVEQTTQENIASDVAAGIDYLINPKRRRGL